MIKRFFYFAVLFLTAALPLAGQAKIKIKIWDQMIYAQRDVLAQLCRRYEKDHPDVEIDLTYRETEELRAAYQSAAMGGSGPDLVYGPNDQVGPFGTMGIIRPLEDLFTPAELAAYDPMALVHYRGHLFMIGDTVGNHLMLIYNKNLVKTPPTTTDEMIRLGQSLTKDFNGDGRIDQFGLAWNYTEPYFYVPWVSGFGASFVTPDGQPNLNTKADVDAFRFIKDLRDKYKIVPKESDYETANALFIGGQLAMIINGDWSWGDYTKAGIPFGIAPLPQVSSTGRWPAPLVSARGYSVNINVSKQKLPAVLALLKYLTGPEAELYFTEKTGSLPSLLKLRELPQVRERPLLRESMKIMKYGQPMPVNPELRAIWDALRAQYQAVLGGMTSPEKAARLAQSTALDQIQKMNEVQKPGWQAVLVYVAFALLLIWLIIKSSRGVVGFVKGLFGHNRLPYLMMLPAFIAIFSVVFYPFFYNVAISFSNFSLNNFKSWQIVGFQHYVEVFSDPTFYSVLAKTLIWTAVNLIFHVGLGLMLALLIDQTLPARRLFRVLLIIPWAVPQYITALTWRGMFNEQYGAINLILTRFFHMSPIAWLSRPFEAFTACIITNVWLGFPFMMVVALGGLQSIPREMYEAARVDGANAWQRFRNVTWPMLAPVMAPAIVLGGIWTFNNLNVIWLVSNGGEPADHTHILVSYVYKAVFNLYRYGYGAALSMVIFLILLLIGTLYLRKSATEAAL